MISEKKCHLNDDIFPVPTTSNKNAIQEISTSLDESTL